MDHIHTNMQVLDEQEEFFYNSSVQTHDAV